MKYPFFYILFLTVCFSACNSSSEKQTIENVQKDSLRVENRLIAHGTDYYAKPDNKQTAYRYIHLLIQNNYFTQALYLLETIGEQFGYDTAYYNNKFKAASGAKQFAIAKEIQPDRITYSTDKADLSQLIAYYDTIISINAKIKNNIDSAALYNERGEALLSIKEWRAAENDFVRAISVDSTFTTAYYNQIYINYLLGENTKALQLMDTYYKKTDISPDTKSQLRGLHQALKALAQIDNHKNLSDKKKYLAKAKVYMKIQDYELAINILNYFLRKYPQNGDAYAMRALAHFKLENVQKALHDIKKAEKITGKTNTPLSKMIRAKFNQKVK